MITIQQRGDLRKTESWLKRILNSEIRPILERYGQSGVQALASATPKDSGRTAESWSYVVTYNGRGASIEWLNSNINKGVNIAIILQYGHGTGTGGYVQGRDYINPALQPVFDKMADELWQEVTKS